MSKKRDSRAFDEKELAKLKDGGILQPFVNLVKEDSDLQLCFRGNGNPKYISVYCNNRQAFKAYLSGTIEISYRTARYWVSCEKKYNELVGTYGFRRCVKDLDRTGESFEDFLKHKTYTLKNKINRINENVIKELYKDIIKPMLLNYAENIDKNDYFKRKLNNGDVKKDHEDTEKKDQQNLFKSFNNVENGYFFYDLEFHQTEDEKKIVCEMDYRNEPDILGIYFEDKKPKKLVFVEVKSEESSLYDKDGIIGSGLLGHLYKTRDYFKKDLLIKNRKDEAYGIMKSYAALGLRGLTEDNNFEVEDFDKMEPQALFLFTSDVKNIVDLSEDEVLKCFNDYKIDVSNSYKECSAYAFEKSDLGKLKILKPYEK